MKRSLFVVHIPTCSFFISSLKITEKSWKWKEQRMCSDPTDEQTFAAFSVYVCGEQLFASRMDFLLPSFLVCRYRLGWIGMNTRMRHFRWKKARTFSAATFFSFNAFDGNLELRLFPGTVCWKYGRRELIISSSILNDAFPLICLKQAVPQQLWECIH